MTVTRRTTVRLESHRLAEAKRVAAATGKTLTAVIEDALRESFSRRSEPRSRVKMTIPTFRGKGLQPGVNLDDSAALLELMESEGDSHRHERARLRASRRRG